MQRTDAWMDLPGDVLGVWDPWTGRVSSSCVALPGVSRPGVGQLQRTRLGLTSPWLVDAAVEWWCRDLWRMHDRRMPVGQRNHGRAPENGQAGQEDSEVNAARVSISATHGMKAETGNGVGPSRVCPSRMQNPGPGRCWSKISDHTNAHRALPTWCIQGSVVQYRVCAGVGVRCGWWITPSAFSFRVTVPTI